MNQQPKKLLAPGIWLDQDDYIHFSLPELCQHFAVEYTEENAAILEQELRKILAEENWPGPTIKQDACPFCGVTGIEPHKGACVWGAREQ